MAADMMKEMFEPTWHHLEQEHQSEGPAHLDQALELGHIWIVYTMLLLFHPSIIVKMKLM